jgi:hypothetical protein
MAGDGDPRGAGQREHRIATGWSPAHCGPLCKVSEAIPVTFSNESGGFFSEMCVDSSGEWVTLRFRDQSHEVLLSPEALEALIRELVRTARGPRGVRPDRASWCPTAFDRAHLLGYTLRRE